MKKIQFIETGYYTPSNANWSYHIFMVIDATGARMYKTNFGGDSRAFHELAKARFDVERLNAGKGTGVCYKYADIRDLSDIEGYTGKNW